MGRVNYFFLLYCIGFFWSVCFILEHLLVKFYFLIWTISFYN